MPSDSEPLRRDRYTLSPPSTQSISIYTMYLLRSDITECPCMMYTYLCSTFNIQHDRRVHVALPSASRFVEATCQIAKALRADLDYSESLTNMVAQSRDIGRPAQNIVYTKRLPKYPD